jgi:WD40 repeat protein
LLSHNDKLLVCSSFRGLIAWDVETGQERFQLTREQMQGREIGSIGFGPDGNVIAAGRSTQRPAVWDAATGKLIWEGNSDSFLKAAVSPDAQRAVIYPGRNLPGKPHEPLPVIDLAQQRELYRLNPPPLDSAANPQMADRQIEFSPRAKWIAWFETGTVSPFGRPSGFTAIARSPKWTVTVWDAASGKEHAQLTGPSTVVAYAFSRDDRHLALALRDGTVQVWDIANRRHLFDWAAWPPLAEDPMVGSPLQTRELAFTPDGNSLAVLDAEGSAIRFLDLTRLNSQLEPIGLAW